MLKTFCNRSLFFLFTGWRIKILSQIFIAGDLNISVHVLYNYLEANSKVPWEDLRYLFGEIMYGGHITDDWDRKLCISYLEELMQPDLVYKTIFPIILLELYYIYDGLG